MPRSRVHVVVGWLVVEQAHIQQRPAHIEIRVRVDIQRAGPLALRPLFLPFPSLLIEFAQQAALLTGLAQGPACAFDFVSRAPVAALAARRPRHSMRLVHGARMAREDVFAGEALVAIVADEGLVGICVVRATVAVQVLCTPERSGAHLAHVPAFLLVLLDQAGVEAHGRCYVRSLRKVRYARK